LWIWYVASSIAFPAGAAVEADGGSASLIALAIDYWWLGRPGVRTLGLGVWVAMAVYFVMKTSDVQPVTPADTLIPPVGQRLLVAGDAFAFLSR